MLISDALGVTSSNLLKQGVYDAPIGIDLRMHVDAARLRSTRVPELSGSYKRFQEHFKKVIRLIRVTEPGKMLERKTKELLLFPEVKEAGLGVAVESTEGRGVGPKLAGRLYDTAREIIKAGESDPAIFEVAVLFESNFGADLFSDLTIWLILPELEKFNRRVAKKLNLELRTKKVKEKSVTLVYSKKRDLEILLIPHSILADIPLARDWSEIDEVAGYNSSLRSAVNVEVRKLFGNDVRVPSKPQLKTVFLKDLELLRRLLFCYGKAKAAPYDFENDKKSLIKWYNEVRSMVRADPLELKRPQTESEMFETVRAICEDFRHKVEQHEMSALLFNDDGSIKKESAAQKFFWALADSHCVVNDLDITPEPETGRGPADFKLSHGNKHRVIVELKLSTNDKYLDGLTAQLPTYLKAAKVKYGILILVKVANNDKRIARISKVHAEFVASGANIPALIIVDATKPLSASKLKGDLF